MSADELQRFCGFMALVCLILVILWLAGNGVACLFGHGITFEEFQP